MATTTYVMSGVSLLLQQLNNVGVVLAGGFINTYVGGTVGTAQTTFTDSTGTTPNSNPIPLNIAGRPVSAGGAPVAIWVPSGSLTKIVITDSTGAFICSLDNIPGLSDPAALLSLLATVSTSSVTGGADLVANAMRSYDVVASVRAAPVPILASGQTLVIDIEGGVLINDGGGGLFQWSATSTATDDGSTVIKPTAISTANPGRYLRQSNLYGSSFTFNMAVFGCTTSPNLQCFGVINGSTVTVQVPDTGDLVSNATNFGATPWTFLRDNVIGASSSLFGGKDNSATGIAAYMSIANAIGSNAVNFNINNASGAWTNTGTKRFYGGTFTYFLPNGHP
jgi:hypothetical protein